MSRSPTGWSGNEDTRCIKDDSHSELSFVPCKKRQKLKDDNVDQPSDRSVHANDFITLIFVDPCGTISSSSEIAASKGYQYFDSKPTYTHQLFDEEKISFLSDVTLNAFNASHDTAGTGSDGARLRPGLLIYIKCDDLSHYAATRMISLQADKETLMEHIKSALPLSSACHVGPETSFHSLVGKTSAVAVPGNLLLGLNNAVDANMRKHKQLPSSLSSFEMHLASAKDVGAQDLLLRAELIAKWYIETADSVNFSDERWEVLNLHRKDSSSIIGADGSAAHADACTYSFAGYMTLFTFNNPFLGSKIRVCQAFVLPHMQGKGLGRMMLLAVYQLAKSRSSIVEVTVEDPAPAFEKLRDSTDCEWALMYLNEQYLLHSPLLVESARASNQTPMSQESENSHATNIASNSIKFENMIKESAAATPAEEKARCKAIKLTPAQTSFAFEALQYAFFIIPLMDAEINSPKPTVTSSSANVATDRIIEKKREISTDVLCTLASSAEYRAFRLKVKRRLLNANKFLKERTSTVMQNQLEELYKDLTVRYQYCLEPLSRTPLLQS